jgi:hypothetical protein
MPYTSNVKDVGERTKYYTGFPKGLNTYQDAALVHDQNVVTAKNAMLDVDGITRRFGTTKPYDEGSATYTYALGRFYNKSAGTKKFLRIAKVGATARLQELSSSTWSDVSAVTTWTNTPASMVQASNKIFIHNGTDSLRYYDGSSITTYTTVNTPTTLAVVATGTTGSTDYSYRVDALNATGRTAACARVSISDGNATLSSSNYNALTWDAMAGATAYNIYGRNTDGVAESYMATVYTNSYDDTGADTPVETLLPNEQNTTGGIKAKYGIFTLGRQFVIGVTEGSTYYPTRLYYSGTVNYIDAFVGGDYGGGWVEIEANDGGEIVDIAPYQNGVLVIKTNGIFKFYFTSAGLPAVDEVTKSHGGVSNRAGMLIDNDYVYIAQKDNRISVHVAGQQSGFTTTQIRTNDIGLLLSGSLTNVAWGKLSNMAAFYFDYKYGFTYTSTSNTENDRGFVLDLRYGGWVEWDGDPMKCNQYLSYDDDSSVELYGASNTDGYVVKMFQTQRNDNGSGFTTTILSKQYNQKMFDIKKVYRNPTLWFKYVSGGTVSATVYTDGTQVVGTASISPTDAGTMVGEILPGESLTAGSPHTMPEANTKADYPAELTMLNIARSIQFQLVDSNVNSNWLLMGIRDRYTPLEGMPLDQEYKVYLS